MLVSTIITNGQLLADIPNTSFYTPAESLFAVQLAWEQVYAFLATNNDDYFVTPIYLNRSITFTGDAAIGSDTVSNVSSLAGLYVGMTITDSGSRFASGTTIKSFPSTTSVQMSTNALGTTATDIFTITPISTDTNRQFVSLIDTTAAFFSDGFFRLRLFQYQGYGGTVAYYPVQKMTIENFGNTQNTPAYRFEGKYLALYDPSNYSTYCLWYYPRPVTLTTSTDLTYPYSMVPEFMAYQLAIEIRRKMKQDVGLWQQRANEIMAVMLQQMSRDDSHGEPIKNQFGQGFSPYI